MGSTSITFKVPVALVHLFTLEFTLLFYLIFKVSKNSMFVEFFFLNKHVIQFSVVCWQLILDCMMIVTCLIKHCICTVSIFKIDIGHLPDSLLS